MNDWALAYRALACEVARGGRTVSAFAKSVGVHRSTLDRMRRGAELTPEILWKVEGGLGWPRDLLACIARHDLDPVRAVDPDLARWLTLRLG